MISRPSAERKPWGLRKPPCSEGWIGEDVAVADAAAVADALAVDGGDDHLFLVVGGAGDVVLGRIVAQAHLDARDVGAVLALGQGSLEGVALEGLPLGGGVEGVHVGPAQLDEVAHLDGAAAPEQVGVVRAEPACAGRLRPLDAAGRAGTGDEQGRLVLVGGHVQLNAGEGRLGEGHRRQGGTDAVADGHGIGVLALLVGGDDQVGEPAVGVGLEEAAARCLRGRDDPVVDEPAAGDVVPVEVVEVLSLQGGVHEALIVPAGVVGVLLLAPLVLVEQLLRHVPLLDRRVQGVEEYARPRWRVMDFAASAHAQPGSEVLLRRQVLRDRPQHQHCQSTGVPPPRCVHRYLPCCPALRSRLPRVS